jgi:hypothetical protein
MTRGSSRGSLEAGLHVRITRVETSCEKLIVTELAKKLLTVIDSEVYYHIHKTPPFYPRVRNLNLLHTFIPCFCRIE